MSRRLLQAILAPHGACHVAVGGREALEAFKMALKDKQPYNLICLDIMMPEMDGQEVLKEIRRTEDELGISGCDRAKIIMTTALDG